MRVDDVPWFLTPAFHAYGYGCGAILETYLETIRRTCVIERPNARFESPRIECVWHEHLPAYLATCLPPPAGARCVWMNHPAWYMRPVHVVLAWNGVTRLRLGSTGHGGRAALDEVIADLRDGASTGVAVDGPAGPVRVMRRGALDMSVESGLPIVAFRFEYERAWRAPDWDRKHLPLPGSRIRVIESAPILVTRERVAEARDEVTRALG